MDKAVKIFLLYIFVTFSSAVFFFQAVSIRFPVRLDGSSDFLVRWDHCLLFLKYFFFCGLPIAFLILAPALFKWKRSGEGFLDCLYQQILTMIPAGILTAAPWFHGRALDVRFPLPLSGLIFLLVIGGILVLNLRFHTSSAFNFAGLKSLLKGRRIRLFSLVAFTLMLLYITTGLPHYQRFTGHKLFVGDEPKYLRMAFSLAKDGDLDVSNNLSGGTDRQIRDEVQDILASGSRKFGHLAIIGKSGGIYHTHMPGLSMLIAPAIRLDLKIFPSMPENSMLPSFYPQRFYFTRVWLLILAVAAFILFSRLMNRVFPGIPVLVLTSALFLLSSPVISFMFQLYPETSALLLTLLALNGIFSPFRRPWINRLALVTGIGFLPWLYQRFLPLSLGLYLVFVIAERKCSGNFKNITSVSGFLALSSVPYFYYFYSITGSFWPNIFWKLYGETFVRLSVLPVGLLGNFLDVSRGVFWIFPWTLLSMFGFYIGWRRNRGRTILLFFASVPYYIFICTSIAWSGIVNEPGRYLIAIFPVFFLLFAETLSDFMKKPSSPLLLFYIAVAALPRFVGSLGWFRPDFSGSYFTRKHAGFTCISLAGMTILWAVFILLYRHREQGKGSMDFRRVIERLPGTFLKSSAVDLKRILKFGITAGFLAAGAVIFPGILGVRHFLAARTETSLFSTLNKLDRFPANLTGERSDRKIVISSPEFEKACRINRSFRMEAGTNQIDIRLAGSNFLEKIPAGCYRVEIEMNEMPSNPVYLYFAGERRSLQFRQSGPYRDEVLFAFYRTRYDKPDLIIRRDSLEQHVVEGKISFYPLPSAVYSGNLMIRPSPRYLPVRKLPDGQGYRLSLLMNTKSGGSSYRIEIAEQAGSYSQSGREFQTWELYFPDMQTLRFQRLFHADEAADLNLPMVLRVLNPNNLLIRPHGLLLSRAGGEWTVYPGNTND